MRLMIIGVITFGLAAVAMIWADGRLNGLTSMWGGDVKQVRYAASDWTPRQRRDVLVIPVPGGGSRLMTGFPSYAALQFPLPQYTPVAGGRFIFEFALQLPQSGGGAVRIVINNEKRAELLLDPARERYRMILDLTDADLDGRTLAVSLSADGYGAGGECPDDRSRTAVIEIDPKTRLEIRLGAPLTHAADAALIAGDPLRLMLPAKENRLSRERALALALALRRAGGEVEFLERRPARGLVVRIAPKLREARYDIRNNEIVVAGPRHASILTPALRSPQPRNVAPAEDANVFVETLGVSVYARQFRHEVKWRVAYALKDMPAGLAPTRLNLAMFHSLSGENPSRLLSVAFNGRLLHSAAPAAGGNRSVQGVSLPLADAALENVIEISVLSNEDRIGVCNPGREAFAQLLKATSLSRFAAPGAHRQESLTHFLAGYETLAVAAPFDLSEAQFREGATLLARVTPRIVRPVSSEQYAASRRALATVLPLDRFRAEIEAHLATRADAEDAHEDAPPRLWIAAGAHVLDHPDADKQFAPLTRDLANRIAGSTGRGVAIVIALPPVDDGKGAA